MLRDRVILRYSLHRSVDQNIFYNYSNPRKTYKSHIRLKKWSIDFLSVLGVLQVISLKMSNECPPSKMALQSMVLEMKIDSTTGQRRDILRHCIGFLKGCKKVKLSRKSHSAVRKMILEILLGSQTSRPKHFVSPEKICALDIIGIQIIGQCCCARDVTAGAMNYEVGPSYTEWGSDFEWDAYTSGYIVLSLFPGFWSRWESS